MLKQDVLDNIIRRVAEAAEPQKIILFGSAARGDAAPHSDIDLLIVKEGGDSYELTSRIYNSLYGAGAAVDAIVVSPEDVERYGESRYLVIGPALLEGKVVYESR